MAIEFTDTNLQHIIDADAGSAYLNGLTAITVSLWVKSDAINTDDGFVVSEAGIDDDYIQCRYDSAGASGGGDDVIKIGFHISGTKRQYESASNVQVTVWQHLVFGWESGSAIFLYIDGAIDTPTYTAGAQSGSLTNITSLLIGRGGKNTATGGSWNGLIDDVRIYNRKLAVPEIETIYTTKGTDGIVDGFLARWLLDELQPGAVASGADSVKDQSQNGNHGTPNSSPTYAESIIRPIRLVI